MKKKYKSFRIIITLAIFSLVNSIFPSSLTVHSTSGDETIDLINIEKIFIINSNDNMISIEGGEFVMGDHYSEGWDDELPTHTVNLSNFSINKYEITHKEFITFLNIKSIDSTGYYNENKIINLDASKCAVEYSNNHFIFSSNNVVPTIECPIIEITWFGACEYSNWLSEIYNLDQCYTIITDSVDCNFNANGYRLPTEAEWEYAARGGVNHTDDYRYSGCHETSDLTDYAWYSSNSTNQLQPVGEKLENQLGIFDMSGNAYEFCWDWFSSEYYNETPTDNPLGPETGDYRVSRGADWNDSAIFNRVTARYSSYPYTSNGYLGFRIAKSDF